MKHFNFILPPLRLLYWPTIYATQSNSGGFDLHTSYIAPHTSHPIPHTPYLTPHTSHLIHHTSYIVPHTSHLIPHTSHLIHHTSYIAPHVSYFERILSPVWARNFFLVGAQIFVSQIDVAKVRQRHCGSRMFSQKK